MEEVVELKKVSFSYDSLPVLRDITLSVKKGDLVGVIGPNGGGKTTLLKIILGLLQPTKGKVSVFGKPPETGRGKVGYVPQISKFDREFPIDVMGVVLSGKPGNIARPGWAYGQEEKSSAIEALETVGMKEYAKRQISKLSGGQIQRVLLARALMSEPGLLLLDEPISSLDPDAQKSFYELLGRLKEKMAIMIVTHDLTAVTEYMDKLACLNGNLYYHGKTKEGIKHLEATYQCPIELIAHGTPHRVLRRHK
ncbi:ATP-binding cassette domain-containing protein [Candidatus Micrarchaeota archaeon]|nr:ATP-binding cassette domain-containing protein [Candidatus Micrarchaeota archaeon]MBD3417822.1 ATP-binding cassette domain-containing protein [Candidatus Micrarchaeota archaeon]